MSRGRCRTLSDMPKTSAGLLLYRGAGTRATDVHLLLVHPGGPFWARKDLGSWSIPKGEYVEGETALDVAVREFREELGQAPPPEPYLELGEVRQAGGKRVAAWAVEGDLDVAEVVSNEFEMEWPRGSGVVRSFPEVDRAEWFAPEDARERLVTAQAAFVDRLIDVLTGGR